MQEFKKRPAIESSLETSEERLAQKTRQSQRLLLALVILIAAIAVVIVTDRQFWFGSNQLILDSDGTETAATPTAQPVPVRQQPAQAAKRQAAKSAASKATNPPAVTTTRTVLPPLNVEIVAGNARRAVRPANQAATVQMTNPAPNAGTNALTSAVGREPISSDAVQQASYPPLAQHMNVQGSVVLKALIGSDGIIQDLHVLSGPAILAAAAQQAVREWHFKPILQDGRPVETMANIVVNFSIRIADSSEKITLAESRSDRVLVITR